MAKLPLYEMLCKRVTAANKNILFRMGVAARATRLHTQLTLHSWLIIIVQLKHETCNFRENILPAYP